MKLINIAILAIWTILQFSACTETENPQPINNDTIPEDMSGFVKGADVSWVSEMERNGLSFYNADGEERECMTLMKELGMNAIRLRVWVDPVDGWCNKNDLLLKAKRAANLNMRIMIDFHYSDWWADPGKQNKPAAWEDLSFTDLCQAVTNHTTEILTALKKWEITPEWVQVGNETTYGMLWPDGNAGDHMDQYAKLNNCGYDAVKAVFPEARVVVHIDRGNNSGLYSFLFGGLKDNGGKWDVIGMSLYPDADNWQTLNTNLLSNVQFCYNSFGKDIMICEVGMNWDEEEAGYDFLSDLIVRAKTNEHILGVFYWEPEAYNSWKGYQKGAFTNDGKPTKAMNAFSEN